MTLDEVPQGRFGVLIVEDDAVTRKSLCLAIEAEPRLKLLAAFDSVKPALAWLEAECPDVLMTDLGLPDGSGIDIIHACAERHPQTDIMVVTNVERRFLVSALHRYLGLVARF